MLPDDILCIWIIEVDRYVRKQLSSVSSIYNKYLEAIDARRETATHANCPTHSLAMHLLSHACMQPRQPSLLYCKTIAFVSGFKNHEAIAKPVTNIFKLLRPMSDFTSR